ncbi:3'5'-cyclic nucleotide phosphodiesterase [Sphaeroforma arctica JP610]|uniref:3'5'-cyclic nucleotide phosphodiesterase n=1 Tax=Sphaeroforma arctica JP610 TaxID=667725 RepID=A0A0L0FR74_9EUKA|nr:3'5'-cyclic nucleotide phosphodiesterase [Sphaeroforma arctica JP610]KNC79317.1 3'5'-cyclic nucleotide phosphodiesterase [Sphaeroforma arctica JP610]|eukprot:XP_014153219.1 3'5'-cyclic nucleotide phosphodiesterase [Sphaeroforma arctica JP610]
MGWMAKFHIDVITLRTFLKVLAHGYRADNPFHNAVHAADVTQAVYYFINSPGLRDRLTDVEKFTAVIAAVIHDVDHPGLNNAFLEKSNDLINLIHGSSGTLERHHLTAGLDVLFRCDLLKQMTPEDREHVCSLVKELVLATDMARHGEFMEKFNGLHTNGVDWSNSGEFGAMRTSNLNISIKAGSIRNT